MMMPMVEIQRVGLTQALQLILIESIFPLLNKEVNIPATLVTGLLSITKLILRLPVEKLQILTKLVKVSPLPLHSDKDKLSDVSKLDSLNLLKELQPY
jgi:hypothetical protein